MDPPYVHATRKSGSYAHELSDDQHRALVAVLLRLQGAAVLSGYPTDLYAPLEAAGWVLHDFAVVCMAAGRTRASGLQGAGAALAKVPRVEAVWVNPAAQSACKGA